MKFEWENILILETSTNLTITSRLRVFGGWIIKNGTSIGGQFLESMVFVPDTNHEWEIKED